MAVGDKYRLVVTGTMLGSLIKNIFYYEMTGGSGAGATQLASHFLLNGLSSIGVIMSSDVTLTSLTVENLNQSTDFTNNVFAVSGVRTSASATSFLAWGFRLAVANINYRPGAKRFAGVALPDISDNSPVAGIVTALNNCATYIGNAISNGGNTYQPRVFSRRWEPDLGVFTETYIPVINAVFDKVTTQSTRKPWVGI